MITAASASAAVWRGLDEVPGGFGPSVIALGVFDGMHRGHARLLGEARRVADSRRSFVVMVTFDPHPATVAGPPRDTTAIATLAQRIVLARARGADRVLVLPFDDCLAAVPAERFAETVLVDRLHAEHVVVGENFRFGSGGRGDVALMRSLGERLGFTVDGLPLVDGCSSTRVRALVSGGHLPAAARVLGRPVRLEGWTVNDRLDLDDALLLPPPGDYEAVIDDQPTVAGIAPDRTVWLREQPDGPTTVTLLRAIQSNASSPALPRGRE